MAFMQVIEMVTSRIAEVEALTDEWKAATEGKRKASRAVLAADRDRSNTYVQMVEFASYEEAMENSNLPETADFAGRLAALCDGPPAFRNLDVRRIDDLG